MVRRKLAVVASVEHVCPKCEGADPNCTACDGVGKWRIKAYENPPPPPKPLRLDESISAAQSFEMRQRRRLA